MTAARSQGVGYMGAVAIGIGGMVGGGIFAVLGVVATDAGGGAPLAFLLGGSIALLTASSYASLSVAYPNRGGSVVFIDRVFGTGVATGALNNLLWFGYLVTLALYAVAFASYAATFLDAEGSVPAWTLHLLITAAIVGPTGLNLLSASAVARTETAIVALKLGMLVLVGGIGMTSVSGARLAPGSWPSIPAIATAGMLVFVAYEGFELIANAAEDVREPGRILPRAFFTAVGAVIVLYVAIAVVTVGSLSPQQIGNAADFALAEAAKPSLGRTGFVIVASSALLATLSAINATLYGAARLSFSIAKEGELPPVLERRVWSEPIGLLITAGVSSLLANLLSVTEISSIASAVFLMVFAAVNAAAARAGAEVRAHRIAATAGVIGCGAALTVLSVDTARHRPLALGLLAAIVVASLVGEAAWLGRHRHVRLGDG